MKAKKITSAVAGWTRNYTWRFGESTSPVVIWRIKVGFGIHMAKVAKRRGRYILDFYDNQGKRRWITTPKGTTKKKAREALREIEGRLEKGIYLPDKKIPLFHEVARDWLEYKQPNVRNSTLKKYRGYVKHHFIEIVDLKINRIDIAKIEKLIAKKQLSGMNITTLRKIISTLNQIMRYAVRHKYIEYNPVREIERPRDTGDVKRQIMQVLNPDEINRFLAVVDRPIFKTLFRLAIMSGARQGELLGLKWKDLDRLNNQIDIRRTFNENEWYPPKTTSSYRKINLGPSIMSELKKWRLTCPPCDLDLIFPNEVGKPINHSNLRSRQFYPALKRAQIRRIRFHDLRHTFASILIEQGENIKYIQTQMGHANPTVTLNTYAHLFSDVNPEAALRLEKTILNKNGIIRSRVSDTL